MPRVDKKKSEAAESTPAEAAAPAKAPAPAVKIPAVKPPPGAAAAPSPKVPKRPSRLAALYRPRILVLAAIAAVVFTCLPRIQRHLPDISTRPEYQISAAQLKVTQRPYWVPHDLVEQVVHQADLPEQLSLLDDNLVDQIAEAFRLHPWIEKVVSVRKSLQHGVVVQLEYRRPAAMVEVKQGVYPVDAGGVLLPPADFSVAETKRYPLIANIRSTPQGPAGSEWGDPAVSGAARLASDLAAVWKKLGLVSIVCPRDSAADGVFELTAAGGSRIVWGRAPGSKHPGELSTDKKIGRLQKYIQDFGGFDLPHGPYVIDIRHWKEISRRPMTAERRRGTQWR